MIPGPTAPIAAERAEFAFSLRTLIAFRLVVTAVLLLAGGYVGSRGPDVGLGVAPGFFWFLGFAFGLNLVYLILLARTGRSAQVHAQILGDIVTITGLVYFTGVASASFVLLYPIAVLLGATLLGGGVRFAVAAVAFYGGLLLSVRFAWLSPAGLVDFVGASAGTLAGSIVFVAVPSGLAALVGQYLASTLATADERLQDASGKFADLALLNRQIVEAIPSGLLLCDHQLRVTFVNKRAEELLNRPSHELVGSHVQNLFPQAVNVDEPCEEGSRPDLRLKLDNGQLRLLGLSISRLAQSQGTLIAFRDLTDLRRLEDQVRATERLAAAGHLAAQMAHEIRNPLGAIAGASQLLAEKTGMPSDAQRLLDIIAKESRRLSGTLQGFLASARSVQPSEPRRCEVASVAGEVLSLASLSHERAPSHDIEFRQDGEAYWIAVPASDARQILWNVVRNALEAMPGGGRLQVALGRAESKVSVTVLDEGPGFKDLLAGAAPVSSKAGGNGIGLAVVHRIVAENGGRVTLGSQATGGGRVEIEFPAMEGMA